MKRLYFNIVEKHPGKFYPKKKLDDVKGSKIQKTFGKSHPTARKAAIFLAEYMDSPWELGSAPPRAPPGSRLTEEQKKQKRLDKLCEEANELLGLGPMTEAEEAQQAAQEADFAAWRAARDARAPPVVVAWVDEPPAPKPAPQWDADVLAEVARIQAMAPGRA